MDCPSCRATIPEGAKFCTQCGARLPRACPACGHLTPAGAKFCQECGASVAGYAPNSGSSRAAVKHFTPAALSTAERRQLTVMFCDLVGSTALSAEMDPEDLREIIGAYQRRVVKVIERFDGFIAKYMGDGVLVYFGYPQAHEYDAERAVRAGLKLAETVHRVRPRPEIELKVRVGIATGLVVVGDLIGSGAAQEQMVVGETPNLAARLQTMAEPNAVVIAASTRRLIGGLFECEDLGPVEMKGFVVPVSAYRVLGTSKAQSRFEAFHATGAELTPLVGREEEVDLLLRRWRQAKSGEGRIVLLSGEPGIGKSRLIAALVGRLKSEPHTSLRYFCSTYHTDSALHPVTRQLERAAGFDREDGPEARLRKLAALLVPTSSSEDIVLLADLLSIATADRYPPVELSPKRKSAKTFEALLRQLELLAHERPVLMVYEDVHWIDPTSRELLDMVVERVRALAVLLVITFRPELAPPWIGQAHVTTVVLNRLHRHEGARLVERVAGREALPEDVVAAIVERTDGVPLFVEELTKAVVEARASADAVEVARRAAPTTARAIPATLHDSLMARLDRLGPAAKELAQVGAAIGRQFSYELVAAVARRNEAELRNALERLVGAGLLFQRSTLSQATFLFKHVLVQEAAYGSLLRDARRQLHQRVAEVLAERFPDVAGAQPELLARHWTEAGCADQAVPLWLAAGRLAMARSALNEAEAHLRRGLQLLATLPPSRERDRIELDLQTTLGAALISLRGYAATETGDIFARARELCLGLNDVDRLFPVLFGAGVVHLLRGGGEALELAEEFLRLAGSVPNEEAQIVALRAVGVALCFRGRFNESCAHLDRALMMLDSATIVGSSLSRYPFDPRSAALGHLALALCPCGYFDRARKVSLTARAEIRRLGHLGTLAQGLWLAAVVEQFVGNAEMAGQLGAELVSLSEEQGFTMWYGRGLSMRGWAATKLGRIEDGIADIVGGIDAFRRVGASLYVGFLHWLLCNAHLEGNQPEEALAAAEEGLRVAPRGDQWIAAELHRARGAALLRLRPVATDDAEAALLVALQIAREQQAKLWELRAGTCLARLRCVLGRIEEARALLTPLYSWFTEGFDTPDLQQAKALLVELGCCPAQRDASV